MHTYTILALAAFAQANPIIVARQGVTANISPSAAAPPGCIGSVSYSFGVVAKNVISSAVAKRQASQIGDGQVQAATASAAVSQITDGQVQAATGAAKAVSQIRDGQIQVASSAPRVMTVAPISMITDGQIQAGLHTMNMMAVARSTASPVAAVSQIKDGQIQAPTHPVAQIADGQIQAPATTTMMPVTESKDGQPVAPTMPAVSQKSDGQVIAATSVPAVASSAPVAASATLATSVTAASSAASTAPATSPSGGTAMVVCKGGVSLTLKDTKLTDQAGRTGYIASNFQFQFDNPPQAGALYTAGFSVCENGTLAIGGSSIFYQCLSGSFYNIYDRSWAAQCSPAYIQTMQQVDC